MTAPVPSDIDGPEPVAWLVEGEDLHGRPTWVAVTKDPTSLYGPNMKIRPLVDLVVTHPLPADEQGYTADKRWRLLPVEPTDAMADAGLEELKTHLGPLAAIIRDPVYCYRAMLAAAPTHPVPVDGPADAVSEAEVEAALLAHAASFGEHSRKARMRLALEAAQRARK